MFNAFQENTYVISDETNECVIVDPGCYDQDEKQELVDYISDNNLTVVKLLNTHCHIDHVLGNDFVKRKYNIKLYVHPTEEFVLNAQKILAPHYGFHAYQEAKPDSYLKEGDEVSFGKLAFAALFVPGHFSAFEGKDVRVRLSGLGPFHRQRGRVDTNVPVN